MDAGGSLAAERGEVGQAIELQEGFDSLAGPREPVHVLALADGRVARYIDEGERSWRAVVFFGGLGTSVGAFSLTEFARSTREALRLRVISVERNGLGGTPFDPTRGYAAAVDDVLAVLAALAVERFAVVAFSGGAPFAAALAERVPHRLISLHLASAAAGSGAGRSGQAVRAPATAAEVAADPRSMWRFPPASPVHRIPGFAGAAAEEGIRALGSGGRGAKAYAHEWRLLRSEPLPELGAVDAPAYLYWGTSDDIVPPAHARAWRSALGNVAALRSYHGEAHDVQYRHWDQILVDAAGRGGAILVCHAGRTRLVPTADVAAHLAAGATLGLCAWVPGTPSNRSSPRSVKIRQVYAFSPEPPTSRRGGR